jgi:hypothetical protein
MQRLPIGSIGERLSLTTVLSHFPELKLELDLLRSVYNTDLTKGEMEVFWTWTRWASESLSSRAPPSVTRSPPDGVGGSDNSLGASLFFFVLSFSYKTWDSN